jgi:hypothetical protein
MATATTTSHDTGQNTISQTTTQPANTPTNQLERSAANRRFERFAEVCQELPDRPRLGDERDERDVATAPRAPQPKLLAHPGHEFGPGDPRVVVGGRFVA